MDLISSLLTFTMFWKLSWSLQCYTCEPSQTSRYSCEQFDYSDKYLKQCEKSSMCYKRITTLEFGDGVTTKSIQRGCASQTTNGEQEKKNKKWVAITPIHEAYNETCSEDPTNADRATKTTHCYCRGDGCNAGHRIGKKILEYLIVALAVALFR